MPERPLDRFIRPAAAPAYMNPAVLESLPSRVASALEELRHCRSCPRLCNVDRLNDERQVCRTGRHAQVSSAFAHFGEEACLRGTRGSGTIFFAMCNLRCVFCQNADISQGPPGREVDASHLADLMLALQDRRCHNINLVTPEHVVPQVVEALAMAIGRGLRLPIVYNTSAYDSLDSLRRLDGLVDIYMPDFKLWSDAAAARLLKADDYPERARDAIREMHRQVGVLQMTPDGVACRGVLVRHLVMPGLLDDSRQIFKWLARGLSPDTFVNIMAQYHPEHRVGLPDDTGHEPGGVLYAEINRPPSPAEYDEACEAAREAGLWRFDK